MSYVCHTSELQITYSEHTVTVQKRKDTEVVNVRLPKEIVSILDSLINKNIYSSRSEAIREISREYVLEHRTK